MTDRLWMVFDVESIGLHGEGWAVGYTVIDARGNTAGPDGRYVCPPETATGDDTGRAWVAENCPPLAANCATPREVRDRFWRDWLMFKERHVELIADCAWPVEARFLAACVDDEPENEGKPWQGPYPLHELASFMVAAGMDPMATYDRLPDEPMHDPLGDARQSARLLVEALRTCEQRALIAELEQSLMEDS
jgi:hypothetical protein